ncbi:MAG: GTP-binding protein, partial [bacterium]
MKEYYPRDIRNLALIGHATVGKTTLSEAMLYSAGETNRLGNIDDGTTISDYNADEIERKISISTSLLHCSWKNCKLNILDTPGYSDFIGEVIGTLRVADLAVIVINSVSGVEVGTESVWKIAEDYRTPRMLFVSRMDKEHADFDKAMNMAVERFGNKVLQVQIPVNAGEDFDSIIDLLQMKMVKYEKSGSGKSSLSDIPDEFKSKAEELREKIIEMAAENDDELLEKYFENGTLSDDEIKLGLRKGLANQAIFPVLCGSASNNIGIHHLLDFVVDSGPAAEAHSVETGKKPGTDQEVKRECKVDAPLAAIVFKTVSEAHIGELSFFRVISGKLNTGQEVLNASR